MYTSPTGDTCILIAIEGPDRVGKQTQARMLGNALFGIGPNGDQPVGDGKPWWANKVYEVPWNDGPIYEEIYAMLRDGSAFEFPVAFQTLHAANRRVFQARELPSHAGWADVVILDRWTLSTRVYGACDGVPVEVTDRILKGVIEPDLTLVFDGDPFPKDELDAYEANTEFQQKVRAEYMRWCDRDPSKYVKIKVDRPALDLHVGVLARVLEVIGEPTGYGSGPMLDNR